MEVRSAEPLLPVKLAEILERAAVESQAAIIGAAQGIEAIEVQGAALEKCAARVIIGIRDHDQAQA